MSRRPAAGSILVIAATTLLVEALRPAAPTLSLGALYTLAVLAAAVLYGMAYAVAVAVASMLAFNFFFLAPVHTLSLADGRNWTVLAVYLVVGVVASELAARARRRAAVAEQRERETALLSDVAAELLQGIDTLGDLDARADRVLSGADDAARDRFETALAALIAVAREREQVEAMRRADAVKTTIIQSVSHDLRTPLAAMVAALDGLESPELTLTGPDREVLFGTLRLELTRLIRLVENLLELSRLQAGAATPQPGLWVVDELIDRVLDEVDRARVTVTVAAGLPAARVDAVQIQRALVNVVENALRFSLPGAGVAVAARELDGGVAVDVADRGPGLADAGYAMQPFVSGGGGAGLGLTVAHGFVTANGGSLTLAPRGGGGTVATLLLPAERLPATVAG
ncbi:MAG: sensor histidine kinase [Gaiellaceae bacterium]